MTYSRRLAACAATLTIASTVLLGCTDPIRTTTTTTTTDPNTPTTTGTGSPNQKGPNPTDALLRASSGPFAVTSSSARGSGFGGGTLYYPTDPSLGRMGGVVIVPGFMSAESSIRWWGPRIASHGFVVITMSTSNVGIFPAQRASEQNAAMNWMATQSPAASRVDPTRMAAGGWSMGGGGSLDAARSNANIKVVLPMAPWNPGQRYTYAKPTMILSCSSDAIAGNSSNSNVFYTSLTGPKAQLTLSGSHMCPTSRNDAAGSVAVAWLKRYLDGDTRYTSFACPNSVSGAQSWRKSGC